MLLFQASGFILMPLYTNYLTPSDFGILELVDRSINFFFLLTMVNGLAGAAFSFYCQTDNQVERNRTSASLFVATVFSLIVCALLINLFGTRLAYALSIDDSNLFLYGLNTGMLQLLPVTMMSLIQARMQAVRHLTFGLFFLCLRVFFLVLSLVVFQQGLWGIFTANLFATTIAIAVLTCNEFLLTGFHPNWRTFVALLKFSWPFIPNGILGFVVVNADRFFLVKYAGNETLGIFALATKVASLVGVIAFAPLYKSWSAHMYTVYASADAQTKAGQWFTLLLLPSCYLGLAISLFQSEIIYCLSAESFHAAQYWIAPLALYGVLVHAQVLADGPFYVNRRTKLKPIVTGVVAVITVLTMFLLVPRLQILGVVIGLLISGMVSWMFTCMMANRVMVIYYQWGRIFLMLGLACLFSLPVYFVPPARLDTVLLKIILLCLWPVMLWILGFFAIDEIQRGRSYVSLFVKRLRLIGNTFCRAN